MASEIYPLNRGRWADLETDKVRAYLANLRIVSLRGTPHRRRANRRYGTYPGLPVGFACAGPRRGERALSSSPAGGRVGAAAG